MRQISESESASRPVSRVLYGATHEAARAMAIPLGRLSPAASSNQPGRRPGKRPGRVAAPCRPYSVLLPAGLAMPLPLPAARCALTAPFHPYPTPRRKAVCFLWRFPWGCPRRTLSGAVSPWSPDFPLPEGSGHPADWQGRHRLRATKGQTETAVGRYAGAEDDRCLAAAISICICASGAPLRSRYRHFVRQCWRLRGMRG